MNDTTGQPGEAERRDPVSSRRTAKAACNGKALSVQHATVVHGAIELLT